MADKHVTLQVELDLLKYIAATLRVAEQDLTAALDAEYPPDLRKQYPSYKRRHSNSMGPVIDARYCLDQLAQISTDLREGQGDGS